MVIVFEGIDGVGKTTLSKEAVRILRENGFDAHWLSEPSDSELGMLLKKAVLSNPEQLTSFEQTLIFTAERSASIRNIVTPLVKQKKIVVMDRSFVSTYAYQIMTTDNPETKELLIKITENSIKDFAIDILFYLKCDVKKALGRIEKKDKIEERGIEYMMRIQRNYDVFLRKGHSKIKNMFVISTDGDLDANVVKLRKALDEVMGSSQVFIYPSLTPYMEPLP